MSRSGMIMIIMTMMFLFLIINNYNNKKIAKWGIVLFFLIIVIFSITSIWKFFNISALENNPIKILQFSFMNYFAPPMVVFVKFLKESNSLLFGKNTFRFIYAILDFLGSDVEVVSNIQEFTKMEINNLNIVSNVYTVLHYYTRDFGLLFAFVIQFILGMIHGFLFHKVRISKKNNIFLIILFSIMMFPLFMQFFDDKYFSILSTWVQYIFWIWFLTRKKLILKVDFYEY
jgi:oligosaccharide repeat unit polymerase